MRKHKLWLWKACTWWLPLKKYSKHFRPARMHWSLKSVCNKRSPSQHKTSQIAWIAHWCNQISKAHHNILFGKSLTQATSFPKALKLTSLQEHVNVGDPKWDTACKDGNIYDALDQTFETPRGQDEDEGNGWKIQEKMDGRLFGAVPQTQACPQSSRLIDSPESFTCIRAWKPLRARENQRKLIYQYKLKHGDDGLALL